MQRINEILERKKPTKSKNSDQYNRDQLIAFAYELIAMGELLAAKKLADSLKIEIEELK